MYFPPLLLKYTGKTRESRNTGDVSTEQVLVDLADLCILSTNTCAHTHTYTYTHTHTHTHTYTYTHTHTHTKGIGSSAQGLFNAILFCLFTQVVREKLLRLLKCYPSRNVQRVIIPETEETTHFESETRSLLSSDVYEKSMLQKGKDFDGDSDYHS